MPFGPSGVLLPNGPEFDVDVLAPDLKGFPWQRYKFDAWTSPEQRDEVKRQLRVFFATKGWPVLWSVVERNSAPRLSTLRAPEPFFIIRLTRKADRREFEVAVTFPKIHRETPTAFSAKLAHAFVAFEALHTESPPPVT
jgi:hypothetical protein